MFLGRRAGLGTAANGTTHSSHPCSVSPHPTLACVPILCPLSWESPLLPTLPHQALSPPSLFPLRDACVLRETSSQSGFCPVSTLDVFLPLSSCSQAAGADESCQPEPDMWGTSSQTHVGKPGWSCWAQLLPAWARVMPPSPHLEDKATGWKQLLVPPGASLFCPMPAGL